VIPYGRQSIDRGDIDAVAEVLRSDYLTQGPVVPRFEAAVASRCGVEHAVATNSATSALHIACLALGVGAGDIVWTTPITFVASANCALYCGAKVDFVDIDPRSFNLCPVRLERKLAEAAKRGELPKVLIPVHMCGQSCDMAAIAALGDRYGFRIIEDASHAIGGSYRGEFVGNCRYSKITVFSFHPVKIITTGEGGMATTRDAALAERMRLFRSHGITREPERLQNIPDGPWYCEQQQLGFNYRMTDIHAALGLSQLQRIDRFVNRRHEIARGYDEALSMLALSVPWQDPACRSAFHLYVVRLDTTRSEYGHRLVFETLRRSGIGVNLHYMPVYLQPYYRQLGFRQGLCPEAERYYAEAISLPIFPDMSDDQQKRVIAAISETLGR
jgi:UDP-4-amino-4,6-dideoxy-N-acetyl-beta-L-altrosamine transaminase